MQGRLHEKITTHPKLSYVMARDQVEQLIAAFQAELEAGVEATQEQALLNAEFDSGSLSELIWTSSLTMTL